LNRNVALYRHHSDLLKKDQQGHMLVFLGKKTFKGCGGLKITDLSLRDNPESDCMVLALSYPTNASLITPNNISGLKGLVM
jgi:hypothetical protein